MKIHRSARAAALFAALAVVSCGDSSGSDPSSPAPADEGTAANDPSADTTGNTDFADPEEDEASPSGALPSAAELGIDVGVADEDEDEDAPAAPGATPGSSGTASPTPAPKPTATSAPSPAPAPTGYVALALLNPNKFFKRQVRHPIWNPTGPLFSGNCAPASLAMAAKIFGKEPAGLTIEQSIDRVRVMMNKPSDSGGSSSAQVRLGAQRLGLHYRAMAKGELDLELSRKHVVVLTGYPGLDGTSAPSAYQSVFRNAGYYYTFDAHHSIAVFGKTSTGKYVVADPLSKIGFVRMTSAQMRDYWARWGGSGTSVWR